jgi:stage V sporulation protein AC
MSQKGKDNLDKEMQQFQKAFEAQEYQQVVKRHSPKPKVLRNTIMAFIVGGTICALAQVFRNLFLGAGLVEQDASAAVVMIMVFLGALLTGLGVYDNIVKFGGAGAIVPITGFANSIVAPALEFKREGFVYGVGARMFTIAGPVLVYGFLTSIIIGLLRFILG